MGTDKTFSFGENWKGFVGLVDEDRIRLAERSLAEFLKMEDLRGKTFLDIGCGSGLFSYSAFRLGADRIVSFDVDSDSVDCCRFMHQKAGCPENWRICEGSILSSEFVAGLGKFDIVYSWGVLHHTGDMWEAIKQASSLVNRGGFFYIAIYNKAGGLVDSFTWLRIKKIYNLLPNPGKRFLEIIYLSVYCLKELIMLKNPWSSMKTYRAARGMDFMTDVRDWLGGYPYEFATSDEIIDYVKKNSGFDLLDFTDCRGTGNNWFLFKGTLPADSGKPDSSVSIAG